MRTTFQAKSLSISVDFFELWLAEIVAGFLYHETGTEESIRDLFAIPRHTLHRIETAWRPQ